MLVPIATGSYFLSASVFVEPLQHHSFSHPDPLPPPPSPTTCQSCYIIGVEATAALKTQGGGVFFEQKFCGMNEMLVFPAAAEKIHSDDSKLAELVFFFLYKHQHEEVNMNVVYIDSNNHVVNWQ